MLSSLDHIIIVINRNVQLAMEAVYKAQNNWQSSKTIRTNTFISLQKAMYNMSLANAAYYSYYESLEGESSDYLEKVFDEFELYLEAIINGQLENAYYFSCLKDKVNRLEIAYENYQTEKLLTETEKKQRDNL